MKIEDFKSHFIIGARPNLFQIEINQLGENTRFLAKAAQIPDKNIGNINVPYMGQQMKLAGDKTFTDWSITVMLDEDYGIRTELENWMAGIEANESAIGYAAHAEYKKDAYVVHLGQQGNEIAKYKFVGLYPITLPPIDLNWETNDTVVEYAVTFAYDYWLRQ